MSEVVTPGKVESSTGELQFTTGRDGRPRINLSIDEMPPFLVEANAAIEAGRVDKARRLLGGRNVETIRKMAEENTCRTDVMFMLALMFFSVKDFDNSETWLRKVLERQPHALVYHELGRICMFTGRMSEAMEYRRKAIEADPDNARICDNYATDLIRAGRAREGIDVLRKAAELAPEDPLTHSKLLWSLSFLPNVNPQMLLEEHKKWALIHAPISLARTSHCNIPDPKRRLRVGYISPDFRKHSVAYNFEAFLDGRDRDAVEVYGYGNIGLPDEVTERLKSKFDHYRHIRGRSDKDVADKIEQDQVDILVEIGGHTADNRLGVLAYKPAPIQVDYGGISTSGMQQIDYRLTDSVIDSPETQRFYVEESVYLPTGLLCYKPPAFAPPVEPLAAVRNGYVTFASFNNSCKINDRMLELWAQILGAVEDSRLLMKFRGGYDQAVRDSYLGRFQQLGIDRDRIETCGWKSSTEHLQLYNQVDIGLDTFPYTGCLTTLEAMWMGVPVVTLVGKSTDYFLSRAGLTMLKRVGLESLAASSPDEYVTRAVALSQDLDALADMRYSMRQRMAGSELCDAKAYARSVETAYREMWHRWCQDQGVEIRSEQVNANSPNSERMGQSAAPKEISPKESRLRSLTYSDGEFGMPVQSGDLPAFLVEANEALRAGNIQQAAEILNDCNIDLVQRMVQDDPSRTDIMFVVARLFFDTKQLGEAEKWYRRILEQEENALVINELGCICKLSGRLTEEMQYRKRALEADPENTDIFIQFIISVIHTGQVEHAVDVLKEKLKEDPTNRRVRSVYLWAIHYLPNFEPQMFLDEHREWARIHAPMSLARTAHSNNPDPHRKFRVGYISSNFKDNLFARNFCAMLEHHNPDAVEVFGYGKVAFPDGFTAIIKRSFGQYRDIYGASDEAAASMIDQDKIDILVNTGGGHEVANGYGIMKYKPAPVQVDYGAINTTGMGQIDYRFTDSLLDPPELHRFYVEKPVCLPGGFFVYRPPSDSPPVTALPATERDYATFGSFNNNCKINPHMMSLWARILQQVPGSRFILKFSIAVDQQIADRYLCRFEQLGIEPGRIDVHGIKPSPKHLELYGSADIALDTYPFNGCMTTLESLWMGVPVISLTGDKSLLSRTGLSILSRVGLEFFAASTPEEYVAKAIALATKLEALARIRASMRQRMLASTLCDHKAYAVGVETAYREMWHKWCKNRNPEIPCGTT